jgi:hypothetical protein
MTAPDLAAHGIYLRHDRPGEHRTACPACAKGKGDTALAVRIEPDGHAIWRCWRCDFTGTTKRREASASWRPRQPVAPDPAVLIEQERRRRLARATWRQSEPITGGLPFDYLTKRRGITHWNCDRLRWHPYCPWEGSADGCLVACVNDAITGYVTAIWRIKPVMTGKVERRGLGPVKGNAARLFWAGDGDRLAIAEGVEDALAFHQLTGWPTWAALSAGNMAELILPTRFTRVVIVQDNDEPDSRGRRAGPEAAQALAHRLLAEGRAVEIKKPKNAKDANDALRQRSVA